MSKPSSLDEITVKLFDSGVGYGLEHEFKYSPNDAKQEIRELAQSVLLEYKEKHLGREGVKLLNELYERMGGL